LETTRHPSRRLGNDLFVIPIPEGAILYGPVRGLRLLVDATFLDLLDAAIAGSESACATLGLDDSRLDRFLHGRITPDPRPPAAIPDPDGFTVFLTLDCTMRCIYCYAHGGKSPATIEFDAAAAFSESMLDRAFAAGLKKVRANIHGGDISVVWALFERLVLHIEAEALRRGLEVQFSVGSNGFLNPGQREFFLRHMHDVTISLDGDAPIQDVQRPLASGRGSWSHVKETLEAFDAAGFRYGIRSTVTAKSVSKMTEYVKTFCRLFRADRIKVEPVFLPDDPTLVPTAERFVEAFLASRAVAASHGRDLVYSGVREHPSPGGFCSAANGSYGLTPDLSITSCYEVLRPDDPLAEIFFIGRYQPGKPIRLEEGAIERLRSQSLRVRESCRDCFAFAHCSGDCLGKRLRTEDDPHPLRCRINRALVLDQIQRDLKPPPPPGE
jgi:uncharacterized protein